MPFLYTSDWDKIYKFYRNKVISLKRLSKANYYQSFFDLNVRNVHQTWKGINKLIESCKKKNKRDPINFIRPNLNEVPTSDPKEISYILNKYFATVESKLASKIPTAPCLAQLVERQSAVREVEGSSPRPDQHSGS